MCYKLLSVYVIFSHLIFGGVIDSEIYLSALTTYFDVILFKTRTNAVVQWSPYAIVKPTYICKMIKKNYSETFPCFTWSTAAAIKNKQDGE